MLIRKAFMGGIVPKVYATLDPVRKHIANTLRNGNLTTDGTGPVQSTIGMSAGKWYWEYFVQGGDALLGVGSSSMGLVGVNNPGGDAYGVGWHQGGGTVLLNNGSQGNPGGFSAGNTIGFALDMDNRTLSIYKGSVLQITLGSSSLPAGALFPSVGYYPSGTFNFGASAFTYQPPAGYNAGLYQ